MAGWVMVSHGWVKRVWWFCVEGVVVTHCHFFFIEISLSVSWLREVSAYAGP